MMLVGAGALPFPFRSGWDHEFESAFLQREVCKVSVPRVAAKVAIGVSGGPGADKDEACTNAGMAEVADKLK